MLPLPALEVHGRSQGLCVQGWFQIRFFKVNHTDDTAVSSPISAATDVPTLTWRHACARVATSGFVTSFPEDSKRGISAIFRWMSMGFSVLTSGRCHLSTYVITSGLMTSRLESSKGAISAILARIWQKLCPDFVVTSSINLYNYSRFGDVIIDHFGTSYLVRLSTDFDRDLCCDVTDASDTVLKLFWFNVNKFIC